MATEDVWQSILQSLDDTHTVDQATKTLSTLLERAGDDAPAVAAKLAILVADLKTSRGKERALSVLYHYASTAAEVVGVGLDLSHDESSALRLTALAVLLNAPANPKARDRVVELVSDPDANIRNKALQAIAQMEFGKGVEGLGAALHVIPDDDKREEAVQLLDELERAVKMLQDLGLDEGQNLIVDDLILPKIAELKKLFGASSVDVEQVVEQRKHGLLTLGTVTGSAKALALGTAAVANVDEAAQTVANAAEGLFSVVDMLGGLL